MTVVIFVIVLSISIAFLIKHHAAIIAVAALWGFCLGLTPVGPPIAHILNQAGTALTQILT